MSKHTIPTEINIAPRGKSWLNGQLIDGVHGHPTRQSMEKPESAQPNNTSVTVAVPDDPSALAAWLLARQSHLGPDRASAIAWSEANGAQSWDNYQKLADYFAALAATPAGSAVQCTCPSGDGSLQWPCPAHPPAAAALAVPAKIVEALEMLENGAMNVATNAKNRGDGYDEGYANAMAKMARETLDSLTGTFARPPNPDERGWICQHKKYGTWFLPWRAIADDWKRYDAVHGKGSREPDDKTVQTWWNEQCGWIEVCAYGTQLSRPDMDAHEAAFKEAMAADYNRPQQQEEVNHA